MSKDIYEKVCNGCSISDRELHQAIADYAEAEKALFKLGPAFEIVRKVVTMTLITLQGYEMARRKE
jgi:hypothetical protein